MEQLIKTFAGENARFVTTEHRPGHSYMHFDKSLSECIDISRAHSGPGWLVVTKFSGNTYDISVMPDISDAEIGKAIPKSIFAATLVAGLV